MIITNPGEWSAASRLYSELWGNDGVEVNFHREFIQNDEVALWRSAGYFRVARQFSKDTTFRHHVAQLVFGQEAPAGSDDLCVAIAALAVQVCQLAEQSEIHSTFALSAFSKFLMLRFPEIGIVYDSRTRCALWALDGALHEAAFDAEDARVAELQRFFSRWTNVGEPIVQMLIAHQLTDTIVAARRTVDKFLWLRGSTDPAGEIHALAGPEYQEIGQMIFDAGVAADHFIPQA